jgi:hypothetical protein
MSPWMMPSLRLRKSTGCKIDQPISRPGELTTWPLAGTYFYRLFQVVEFEDSAHIVQSGGSWNKLVVSPISLSSPSPALSIDHEVIKWDDVRVLRYFGDVMGFMPHYRRAFR